MEVELKCCEGEGEGVVRFDQLICLTLSRIKSVGGGKEIFSATERKK